MIETILRWVRDEIEKTRGLQVCWGVRMLKDDTLEVFYHPYGCEEEIKNGFETEGDLTQFLEKLKIASKQADSA